MDTHALMGVFLRSVGGQAFTTLPISTSEIFDLTDSIKNFGGSRNAIHLLLRPCCGQEVG